MVTEITRTTVPGEGKTMMVVDKGRLSGTTTTFTMY